jgi:NAD(P)H-hydrate epimerase
MEILTGRQMRNVDRRAIDEMGIPGLELMEAAGAGVAEAFLEDFPEAPRRRIVILCGKGNNGGDGLVAARLLKRRGLDPHVLLLAAEETLAGEAAHNLRAARECGVRIDAAADTAAWEGLRELLQGGPLVLDAMLGTGVSGGARGLIGRAIDDLNRAETRVAAVDLPSGVDGDRAAVEGIAVRADRTYTLCRPKLALILPPAAALAGRWRVIPIGIPDEAVRREGARLEWLGIDEAASLLPPRSAESHKGTFGHLLAVAGSRGKTGAAVLLARGALRCGVGLITAAAPESCQPAIAAQQAELMSEPLPEAAAGTYAEAAASRVLELAAERDALAIGPGLGTERSTHDLVEAVLRARPCPTVADADALNAVAAAGPARLERLRAGSSPLVLTPHPGEAGRLLGCDAAAVQADRLAAAHRLAQSSGAVTVLKGHRTVIAAPDGRAAINSSGNPGMASAGSGDVLCGMVGALLARRLDPYDAARLAVFAHGAAGDAAARELGVEGMIASDLIDSIPEALRALAAARDAR